MRRDIVGVVLVGGHSRRMGRDKALLDIDGSALAQRAAAVLATVCDPVVLATGQERRYPQLSLPQVEDLRADCGPLAGLEAALRWADPRPVLVLACDLPRVETPLLESLLRDADGSVASSRARAWLACRAERLQPLCGLYSAACGGVFSDLLDSGERSVLRAVASLDCHRVAFDDVQPNPFLNVNTPADYAHAGGHLATGG